MLMMCDIGCCLLALLTLVFHIRLCLARVSYDVAFLSVESPLLFAMEHFDLPARSVDSLTASVVFELSR